MKLLLRSYNNEPYVWKDAKYETRGWVVNDAPVVETNIVSILNDNRNQYFKCSRCGEIFRKGSPKWEQHQQRTTDTSKCFDCPYLRYSTNGTVKRTFALQDDGKYTMTEKYPNTTLQCRYNYPSIDIASEDARSRCQYNECATATSEPITDIFTENPGIFDSIITINKVLQAGYVERYIRHLWTEYKMKGKYTIYAEVNDLNIVDHFKIGYRGNLWDVYYSQVTNKLYNCTYENKYQEWNPYQVPNSTIEAITKKIATLYK